MIKSILNYFRPAPKIVYQYIDPKFVSLGNLDGCLYFITSDGKMYQISRDFSDGYEQVRHVMTLMSR